ncbi:cytochrome P450 [Heliocybe sulcata]|uniref:Cytochrome P450 n=1 Tax=Heliocybe sulcata TaxID=5364 RepID=A0A5C3MKM7_9AGAM|nr:cytochrome P450 [Heliocybe sulcata]
MNGGRHKKLQELHARHGPWVRVGPNELSINLPSAVRPIYTKLDRASFYAAVPATAETLITVRDRLVHAHRRQAWTKSVTSEAMQSYVPFLQRRIEQLGRILDRECTQSPVKIDHWLNLFLMDLMGDMGFSGGFETMAAGKDTEGWVDILSKGVVFVSSIGQVPWVRAIVECLPQRGPIESFQKFTNNKVEEIKAQRNSPKRDILGTLLDESTAVYRLSEAEAAADAALIVVAATDTTAQTLITLIRYIMCDKGVMRRLQEEIASTFTSCRGGLDDMDISLVLRLPLLDACIQEALRLMPPGPFGPPRTSGPGGTKINNVYIPPNTTVHVPIYTMQRDPANFGQDADMYVPDRWLVSSHPAGYDHASGKGLDVEESRLNRDAFMPFSAGYGSCVGKRLALQNMKIFVAWLLHTYDIVPTVDFNPQVFDLSYKEHGLWAHDPLEVSLHRRDVDLKGAP